MCYDSAVAGWGWRPLPPPGSTGSSRKAACLGGCGGLGGGGGVVTLLLLAGGGGHCYHQGLPGVHVRRPVLGVWGLVCVVMVLLPQRSVRSLLRRPVLGCGGLGVCCDCAAATRICREFTLDGLSFGCGGVGVGCVLWGWGPLPPLGSIGS